MLNSRGSSPGSLGGAQRSWTRRIVGAFLVLAIGLACAPAAIAAPGDLDSTFSGDGKLTTDFGVPSEGYGAAVARQTDGKIVVAGYSFGGRINAHDFALARYNADGSLDNSFSGDGKQGTDFDGDSDDGSGVAVQADGKIVVAGSSGGDFALARYNTDGALDTSFSGDGKQTTDFAARDDGGAAVALQGDGKIVVSGGSGEPFAGNGDFALARYNADGSLDTSFAGDGKQTTDFDGGHDSGAAMALQGDGKIVVAGGSLAGGSVFALARYEGGDGPPDTTITSGPTGTTTDSTPTFTFISTEAGSTFECRVDTAAFAPCSSPHTTAALGNGAHTFQVRATDQAGNTDQSPASQPFTVAVSAPRPPDSDGDGVPDSADACPLQAASTPNGCPATGGGGSALVSTPIIVAALKQDAGGFAKAMKKVGMRKLARRGSFRGRAHAKAGGVWRINVTANGARAAAARQLTIAKASKTFAGPASRKVKVKLTKKGRRLLRRARRRLTVKVTVSFHQNGGKTVSRSKKVKLKR